MKEDVLQKKYLLKSFIASVSMICFIFYFTCFPILEVRAALFSQYYWGELRVTLYSLYYWGEEVICWPHGSSVLIEWPTNKSSFSGICGDRVYVPYIHLSHHIPVSPYTSCQNWCVADLYVLHPLVWTHSMEYIFPLGLALSPFGIHCMPERISIHIALL